MPAATEEGNPPKILVSLRGALSGQMFGSASVRASQPVRTLVEVAEHAAGGKFCVLLRNGQLLSPRRTVGDAGIQDGEELNIVVPAVQSWRSAAIPSTIRPPWQIWEESLEDQMVQARAAGQEIHKFQQVRALIQAVGPVPVFLSLKNTLPYLSVSVCELSAFVCWLQAQDSDKNAGSPARWDALSIDEKERWLPEDPIAVLKASGGWHALLDQRIQHLDASLREWTCCTCGRDSSSDQCMDTRRTFLARCDCCQRVYHHTCNKPPSVSCPVRFVWSQPGIPKQVEKPGQRSEDLEFRTDRWFCTRCVERISSATGLQLQVGDWAWASVPAGSQWRPAQVLRVDFNSFFDSTPYYIQFFGPCSRRGGWVTKNQVVPWLQGPRFTELHPKVRFAVLLAEFAGAANISGTDAASADLRGCGDGHAAGGCSADVARAVDGISAAEGKNHQNRPCKQELGSPSDGLACRDRKRPCKDLVDLLSPELSKPRLRKLRKLAGLEDDELQTTKMP